MSELTAATAGVMFLAAVLACVVLVALSHPEPHMRGRAERILRIIFRN